LASLLSRLPRRRLLLVGVPLVVVLGAFVLLFFQPQKLFIDDRVDEAPPGVEPSAGRTAEGADPAKTGSRAPVAPAPSPVGAARAPVAPPAPVEVARAAFRSLEHATTGQAIVTELPDGRRILRFEGFETSNGPDLRVYLSAGSSDAGFGREYGEDFVELGRLKGNVGSQNYEIPAGADLAKYRNAVVWCKRFRVGFGVATLG
jgi:hypothetical protein